MSAASFFSVADPPGASRGITSQHVPALGVSSIFAPSATFQHSGYGDVLSRCHSWMSGPCIKSSIPRKHSSRARQAEGCLPTLGRPGQGGSRRRLGGLSIWSGERCSSTVPTFGKVVRVQNTDSGFCWKAVFVSCIGFDYKSVAFEQTSDSLCS